MKKPAEVLAMIISAIKNLREMKGSTTREILHYISSVYDIPTTVARRQTQAALKRGVAYGIIKKNRGHYVLPTNEQIQCQEIAAQEIDLVNHFRNKVIERGGRGCKRRRRSRRSRKRKCKCKSSSRSRRRRSSRGCKRRRRRRKCKCGGLGRRRERSNSVRASPKKKFTDEIPVNTTNDKGEDEPASENSSTSTLTSVEQ